MDANKTQALNADPNRTMLGAAPVVDPNRTMMGTAPTLNATQIIKPIQCPVCKAFNPAGVMFCVDCGLIFDRALDGDAFGAPAIQVPQLVEQSGREHPIRPGTNIIGREGDIALSDGKVSRRHAQIVSTDGILKIEDLGSTNGTSVGNEKLSQGERKVLLGGELISFGGLELRLQMPGGLGANATAMPNANRTSAISAPPRAEQPPGRLIGESMDAPLKPGTNTFGRRAENDVCIADPYVSGRHGTIELTEDGVFLTDVGSTNGTMLNEAKLAPNMRTKIGPTDVIRLGSIELRVELTADV